MFLKSSPTGAPFTRIQCVKKRRHRGRSAKLYFGVCVCARACAYV